MLLRKKKFNVRVHWKIYIFCLREGGREVHGKPVYRGELLKGLKGKGLGQFANLRRGLAKKRRNVFERD